MLQKIFGFDPKTMTVKKEIIAGITTFLTMAYILAVNPSILGNAGMDKGAVFTTTILSAIVGTAVMAIGAPTGRCGSVCYGMVTGQNIPMELTDSDYREMTTDIYGSSNASGAIVNMKGQVIGVIYPTVHEDMPNQICGIGITELKKTIERLSNKESIAYLGIQGGDVTTAAHNEYGTPYGAYVTSVNMGSPAMKAGIQSGDVISKCDTIDIMTYSQLVTNLTNYKADDTATLTVFRQQGDSFQEMEVEVTFTVQKNTTN